MQNLRIRLKLAVKLLIAAVGLLTAVQVLVISNPRRVAESNPWQQYRLPANVFNFSDIGQYFYNAYYDTRRTLGGKRLVRILSVLSKNSYKEKFLCVFFDEKGTRSFSVNVTKSAIGVGLQIDKRYYKEFLLSCPIGSDLSKASYVIVQSPRGEYRSPPIAVQHNPLSAGTVGKEQLVVNCVSVTFGNPSEHRVIEWLEAQRLLGMDKVVLHFYHVTNEKFRKVAEHYEREGFVDIRSMECPFCKSGHENTHGLLLMSPAINKCLYENLGRYKYTAVYDLDELIVPQRHANYSSMLQQLREKYNSSSYAFANWYHFTEMGTLTRVPQHLHMLRHPFRESKAMPDGYSTKSIHASDCVVALHNHFMWEGAPKSATNSRFVFVPTSIGISQHFKRCHFSADTCRMKADISTRTMGDRLNQLMEKQLTAAVQRKLEKLSFVNNK